MAAEGGRRMRARGLPASRVLAAGSDRCPLPAAGAHRRDAGGAGGKRRGTVEEEEPGARGEGLWAFFSVGRRYPSKPPCPEGGGVWLLLMADPPGMQALDRASSAGNCGAGSSCSALGRATCRKRGTANTFDRMIPSARGSQEAAQCCSCGTAGSPPPRPPEGACQELGIRGGAFQNGPFRRRGFSRTGRFVKSDFPEQAVL